MIRYQIQRQTDCRFAISPFADDVDLRQLAQQGAYPGADKVMIIDQHDSCG